MNLRKISIVASLVSLAGCDFGSGSDDAATTSLPAGAKILSVSGRVHDTTGNVRIQLGSKVVKPGADGSYSILDTVIVHKIAGRSLADTVTDTTVRDTARILVVTTTKTDTLREVPLTSWSNILAPTTVVANDVSVNAATGSKISGKVVEAVWWSDDTIAHVQRVPNSTSSDYFSTTIYSLYNDSLYAVNGHKFFVFLRAKNAVSDTLPLASTSIRDIGAQNGALNYTDTFFHTTDRDSIIGVTLVPKDSNVVVFGKTRNTLPPDSVVITEFKSTGSTAEGELLKDTATVYRNYSRYTHATVNFEIDTTNTEIAKYLKDWNRVVTDLSVNVTVVDSSGRTIRFNDVPAALSSKLRIACAASTMADAMAAVRAGGYSLHVTVIDVGFAYTTLTGSRGLVKNLRLVAYN